MPIAVAQNSAAACMKMMKHASNPVVEQTTVGKILWMTVLVIVLMPLVVGIVKGIVERIESCH